MIIAPAAPGGLLMLVYTHTHLNITTPQGCGQIKKTPVRTDRGIWRSAVTTHARGVSHAFYICKTFSSIPRNSGQIFAKFFETLKENATGTTGYIIFSSVLYNSFFLLNVYKISK